MRDNTKMAEVGRVFRRVKNGEITFEEGVDHLMSIDPGSSLTRVDMTDFLYKSLGRPTEEELGLMKRRGRS